MFDEILNSFTAADEMLGKRIEKLEQRVEILVSLLDETSMAEYLRLLEEIEG